MPRQSSTAPTTPPSLGANLQRLRMARGWNLSRMAEHTGLPQSTLWKIEHGQMSLNYEKLYQVAATLKIDVRELFTTDEEMARPPVSTGRRVIDRVGDEPLSADHHYRFRFLCTELKDRLMVPYYLEVGGRSDAVDPAEPSSVKMSQLIGERFVFVLDGPVEFHSRHYATAMLHAGDCLYVDAEMPHAFVSPTDARARLVSVVTSTDEQYLEQARAAADRGRGDASDVLHTQREAGMRSAKKASRRAPRR